MTVILVSIAFKLLSNEFTERKLITGLTVDTVESLMIVGYKSAVL